MGSDQSQNSKSAEQQAPDDELQSSSITEIKASSPLSLAFTPINHQRPLGTEQGNPSSVLLRPSQTTIKAVSHTGQKRITECNQLSVEKRPKIATRGSGRYPTSTKQPTITPAQTPTSLLSLKVTKPVSKTQGQATTKVHDAGAFPAYPRHALKHRRGIQSQGSITTIERSAPQPTRIMAGASSDLPDPELSHSTDGNFLIGESAIHRFPSPIYTPHSQEMVFEGATEHGTTLSSATIVGSSDPVDFCNKGDTSLERTGTIHNTTTSDYLSDSSNAYPLDDDIAYDDIIQLLMDTPGSVEENHIPPSSLQGWDHESRSAAEYDPSLKYSPPDLEETETNATNLVQAQSNWQTEASEDLLDEDVDWDTVLVNMDTIQKSSSVDPDPELNFPTRRNMDMCAKKQDNSGSYVNEVGHLTAFVRPPFPEKVRDRSSVPGMSSHTLLRTCFRIGVMISQTAYCFNHKQDVVFEIYARVTYSSRETLARKQHFQFVDLYKDQQPYPAATLVNWRMGSQIDKDSSAFLDTSGGPRLCWCMCKPMKTRGRDWVDLYSAEYKRSRLRAYSLGKENHLRRFKRTFR